MNNKILINVNNDEDIKYPVNGYIFGIKDFCICYEKEYSYEDIINIKNKITDKKIFVCLNKPIFNDELDKYRDILLKLDSIGLDGIIVGDVAALTYKLKTNIILDQLHLNNSYHTINHYHNNGVNGIVLTNDITNYEINEIKENSNVLLFKQVFGNVHLSTSVRNLVSNYLDYFNIDKKDNKYFIKESNSDNSYLVIEDNFGTHIFNNKKLNLLDSIKNLNTHYCVINTFLVDRKDLNMVISSFINNDLDMKDKIDEIYNCDDGFINKKTIYKVKNDE